LIVLNTSINLDRIKEIELETKHDVIAFTRSLSEQLGDEKK
jgi:adenylosuccinate lyase